MKLFKFTFLVILLTGILGCSTIPDILEILPTLSPAKTQTPAPDPTRTCPPCETYTPSPEISPAPTQAPIMGNEILIRVLNVPIMTDSNKEEYNKDCLFCLHSPDRTRYVAIFHRYLWRHHAWHPEPGLAEWWPTWRIEGGDNCPAGAPPDDCNPFIEWHIYGSQPLYDTEVDFMFEWDNVGVIVTNENTGDSQHVDIPGPFPILSEDGGCEPWGWHSPATAERIP